MLTAIVINVGQGDSILFQAPTKQWGVIDCNIASWREHAPVQEAVDSYDVTQLQILALTHPDGDHYLGMPQWIERYGDDLAEFWDSDLSQRKSLVNAKTSKRDRESLGAVYNWFDRSRPRLTYRKFRPGVFWTDSDFAVDCLSPTAGAVADLDAKIERFALGEIQSLPSMNAASGVVAMFYGKTCLLLGADATGACWRSILDVLENSKRPKPDRTIVKVPHHGSEESNPEHAWEYLKHQMNTTSAIISVGKTNRYGHPHTETIERILDRGIDLVCTSGIEYKKDGDEIRQRDTWTTVYERSGTYNEHGQNVEVRIPKDGFPTLNTRRFG